MHKFRVELGRHRTQVADEPASGFKIPVISQPDKTVVFGDVGEKRELPAGDAAKIALAGSRAQTSQQAHVLGGVRLQLAGIFGFAPAFVAAPGVPKRGARAQVLPFLLVDDGHRAANITAERHAARVVGRAALAAIEAGRGSVEAGIERGDIEGRTGHILILSGRRAWAGENGGMKVCKENH